MLKKYQALLLTAAICAGGATRLMAQTADQPAAAPMPQTVWSGVYSDSQAYGGEKVSDTVCLGCHGAGLTGGDSGPRLVGEDFLGAWNGRPISDLFDFISDRMPENAPGTLKKEDVASVIAYILKVNDMPAGKQVLPTEHDALAPIAILAARP
jgi:mono/diheme cytochrome c family protein